MQTRGGANMVLISNSGVYQSQSQLLDLFGKVTLVHQNGSTFVTPSAHLDMQEIVKPIEQHGFTIADFTADKIALRFFKWDVNTQPVEAIDALQPFFASELPRPV